MVVRYLVNQAANDTTAELASNSDLTLLAQVDTVPLQDGVNEKYIGVSVSGNWASYRYVIFDLQSPYELGYRTGDTSFFGINNGQGTARRDTRFREIDIVNTPPTANAGGPYTVAEGSSIVLNGSDSSDAEQSAASLNYQWDLDGDGIFGETGAGAGRGDEVGANPTFSAAGLDDAVITVSLRVTDDNGVTDSDTTQVTVTPVNDAPVIVKAASAGVTAVTTIQGYNTPNAPGNGGFNSLQVGSNFDPEEVERRREGLDIRTLDVPLVGRWVLRALKSSSANKASRARAKLASPPGAPCQGCSRKAA